ncbi:NADPH-dependent F420 reductase [Pseudomonas sp. NPDC090203]|uniref:NADPH-dependent F420 reductase n=1 Tax=Pseudomonas sp. NPDC090203 TaxID=3364477 RepID=UPI003816BA69
MKIGMLGAGEVALSVARHAVELGHEVLLSNHSGPEKLADALRTLGPKASAVTVVEAASAPVVLLATPWKTIEAVLKGLPDWNGRILIDATNPFLETIPKLVLADLGDQSASEIVAALAPGARVVKAFNNIVMTNFNAGAERENARRVLFVSGDDTEAKQLIADFITAMGFKTIDLGGLKIGGRMQQAGGPLAGHDFLISQ